MIFGRVYFIWIVIESFELRGFDLGFASLVYARELGFYRIGKRAYIADFSNLCVIIDAPCCNEL